MEADDLFVLPPTDTRLDAARLSDQAREYARQSKADNTLRAYRSDWGHFTAWCGERGREFLPARAETVALYVTALADTHKPSTLMRRLISISVAHKAAGFDSPTTTMPVKTVMQGIRRVKGVAQAGKAPALTNDIRAMIQALPEGKLIGTRDRALLLLGFAAALRRSELVGLNAGDVAETGEGLVVILRRSKTDQEGLGQRVGVPFGSDPQTCPVRALRAWQEASGITAGPLFRAVTRHGRVSGSRLRAEAVAEVVKRAVVRVGKDPADYAGHSLRAGLATAAAMAGVEEREIMAQTRHRSLTVRRYIRNGSLFRANVAGRVGL